MPKVTRVVIIGGGPGGYEAALVGRRLGGEVTSLKVMGYGGSAVLTDCVPSKTLDRYRRSHDADVRQSADLGLRFGPHDQDDIVRRRTCPAANGEPSECSILPGSNPRDITERLQREGINLVLDTGRLTALTGVIATTRGRRAVLARGHDLGIHRSSSSGTARGQAGRRADPDLDAGLRIDRAAASG